MTGNKIANRIMTVSNNSQQNNLETVTNENDKEIPKEMYISPKKKTRSYWLSEIKIIEQ